ncbi:hypothetical protein [Tsukamurella pseudospumae]|uniref:Uncharacterized protein n=1 Tax=Tsukamurella pseudospumae TaxID=239498 RepID=A0A137YZ34_9ACTN|nr:hypothetical protein [Tsukamurella pseudospumae]KXO91158.1 hypothetical protein AXK61_06200 [Tsukamurella pseudospumae]
MAVVLDRDVEYRAVTADELRTTLTRAGVDGHTASFLVGLDEAIASGLYARSGDDLPRLIGRPSTGIVEGLRAQ